MQKCHDNICCPSAEQVSVDAIIRTESVTTVRNEIRGIFGPFDRGLGRAMAGASTIHATTRYRPLAQFYQLLERLGLCAIMVYNWDDKEAECYRLYVEEKKSLDEVISHWEARGFTPRYVWVTVQLLPNFLRTDCVIPVNAHFKHSSNDGTFPASKIQLIRTLPLSPVYSSYGSRTTLRRIWWIPFRMRAST